MANPRTPSTDAGAGANILTPNINVSNLKPITKIRLLPSKPILTPPTTTGTTGTSTTPSPSPSPKPKAIKLKLKASGVTALEEDYEAAFRIDRILEISYGMRERSFRSWSSLLYFFTDDYLVSVKAVEIWIGKDSA
ncbi:hypothetical protein CFIO01_11921 [Colletotrichum fioriniae PJ7]|uniref:Uncharacterized protein n=1 Tax=Colletotrichum fioriniae PJ7 TaxID=1445577 RepID=A0A010QYR1_9PEZI|nr:hypothetical protein CFIO01_11921 [Colletotrichum fioriniae PJ7]